MMRFYLGGESLPHHRKEMQMKLFKVWFYLGDSDDVDSMVARFDSEEEARKYGDSFGECYRVEEL